MSLRSIVTSEELDQWLRSTEVTTDDDRSIEVLKRSAAQRRRCSLDVENISSRPCFGVDALSVLRASQQDDDDAESDESAFWNLKTHLQSSEESAPRIAGDYREEEGTRKSRRVTQERIESPGASLKGGLRLVHEERCSSLYQMPASSIEALNSTTQNDHSWKSFLSAMETSQRHSNSLRSISGGKYLTTMSESEETRRLLVKINRRSLSNSFHSECPTEIQRNDMLKESEMAADFRKHFKDEILRMERDLLRRSSML